MRWGFCDEESPGRGRDFAFVVDDDGCGETGAFLPFAERFPEPEPDDWAELLFLLGIRVVFVAEGGVEVAGEVDADGERM